MTFIARLRTFIQAVGAPQKTLRRKILIGNALIIILLLVAGIIVASQVRRLVSAVETLDEARSHVDAAVAVRQHATDLLATVTRLLPEENAAQFSSEVAVRLEALTTSQQALLAIEGSIVDAGVVETLQAVDTEVTNVINIADTMVRQARAEQWHSVVIRVGLLNRDQQEVINTVDSLLNRVQQLEAEAHSQVAAAERAVVIYPSFVFALTLLFEFVLVARVTGSVTRPVERLTESAKQLASGSFAQRVPVEGEDEIGQLGQAFNRMADELQAHYEELEEHVAERTRALETSLRVGRRLSTILDQESLAQEVVDQIQQAFNYYHVHIYLFDLSRKNLLMAGGTGEAGRTMLLRGHHLKAGQGLVGRAAMHNEVIVVPDVQRAPDWLANPLLPETRAELAVPITYGGTVRGVLDVQHNVTAGLDSSDAEMLQLIAAQVAVALQNAELMAQVQTRAERAARINTVSQRIQAATSVEQVLQTAVQELGRTLAVDSAYIELSHPVIGSESGTVKKNGSQPGTIDSE